MRSAALLFLVVLPACQQARVEESSPRAATPPRTTSMARTNAQEALDALDQRVALPLLPMMANHQKQNMRDHLQAVQEIVAAAANDDFLAVEQAAHRIGYSESMARMCTHLGAGAPGFTQRALDFHHTADKIAAAARQNDRAGVLSALGETLSACAGCHAAFKQNVVDEVTWSRLSAAPAGPP